ncbi:hypothetical protein [Actinotalea sp. Marseille-Q4924]|uniref:hypothetical protein n=1 Tax=Actinotalea sp. Marseille-Q4924 TaxID=2866571 RepID=UPI001CE44558|nr:hypothetical protein [Actinotalea sp. Marseille-Q4924]
MTTHLRSALRELGADEAAAVTPPPDHVRTMVRVVRRRRAARRVAVGTVATGAAAAVAVAGVQVAQLGRETGPGPGPASTPTAPAVPAPERPDDTGGVTPDGTPTTEPTAEPTTEPPVVADPDAIFPSCGALVDAPPSPGDLLVASPGVTEGTALGRTAELTTTLTAPSSQYVLANAPTWADAVLLRDGVVVSLADTGEADVQLVDIRPDTPVTMTSTYTFTPCPGAEGALDGPLELVVTAPVNLKEVDGESRSDVLRVTSPPTVVTLAD